MELAKFLPTASVVTRVMQIVFSIITLACAAYTISLYHGWYNMDPINFAMFASITGLGVSTLLLVGPRFNTLLAERLPGIVDCILSGLYAIFYLAVGGGVAAYGTCSSSWGASKAARDYLNYYYYPNYTYGHRRLLAQHTVAAPGRQLLAVDSTCAARDIVIAMGFLAFVAYSVSAVLAGLDIRAGKGLVKPIGFKAGQAAKPSTDGKQAVTNPIWFTSGGLAVCGRTRDAILSV